MSDKNKKALNDDELEGISGGSTIIEQYRDIIHIVQPGETLSGIAQKYGTTVAAILKLNPNITNPDRIQVNQRIVIKREKIE